MAEKGNNSPESDKRRRHHRYQHETALWIEVGEKEPLHRVLTVDVSASGVQIETDLPLPVDSIFKIYLELPMFLDLISAFCRVRHCTETGNSYRVGISFEEVFGVTTKQLVTFLKAYFGD